MMPKGPNVQHRFCLQKEEVAIFAENLRIPNVNKIAELLRSEAICGASLYLFKGTLLLFF